MAVSCEADPARVVDKNRTTDQAARMSLTLLGWRRRVADLYRLVQAEPEPVTAHVLWSAGRDALFAHHPDSPLPVTRRPDFDGLPVAPYDASLRFELPLDPDVPPMHLDVPTATDGVVPFDRLGVLRLPDGRGALSAWWLGSYGGGLFVPVRDASAGSTSYGGGRYLLDTVKGADLGGDVDLATGRGVMVVDLNFLYHPSCAYDAAWVCPLPPPGNLLDWAVEAGEQLPPGGWYG
jgi:uncharacterized protein (DUF1684 family)